MTNQHHIHVYIDPTNDGGWGDTTDDEAAQFVQIAESLCSGPGVTVHVEQTLRQAWCENPECDMGRECTVEIPQGLQWEYPGGVSLNVDAVMDAYEAAFATSN